MTEADAKTKWCPFARLAETPGTYNRCGPAANLECVGAACMAWRASSTLPKKWSVTFNGKTEDWHWDPRGVDKYESAVVHNESGGELTGYCGLAGRP